MRSFTRNSRQQHARLRLRKQSVWTAVYAKSISSCCGCITQAASEWLVNAMNERITWLHRKSRDCFSWWIVCMSVGVPLFTSCFPQIHTSSFRRKWRPTASGAQLLLLDLSAWNLRAYKLTIHRGRHPSPCRRRQQPLLASSHHSTCNSDGPTSGHVNG